MRVKKRTTGGKRAYNAKIKNKFLFINPFSFFHSFTVRWKSKHRGYTFVRKDVKNRLFAYFFVEGKWCWGDYNPLLGRVRWSLPKRTILLSQLGPIMWSRMGIEVSRKKTESEFKKCLRLGNINTWILLVRYIMAKKKWMRLWNFKSCCLTPSGDFNIKNYFPFCRVTWWYLVYFLLQLSRGFVCGCFLF